MCFSQYTSSKLLMILPYTYPWSRTSQVAYDASYLIRGFNVSFVVKCVSSIFLALCFWIPLALFLLIDLGSSASSSRPLWPAAFLSWRLLVGLSLLVAERLGTFFLSGFLFDKVRLWAAQLFWRSFLHFSLWLLKQVGPLVPHDISPLSFFDSRLYSWSSITCVSYTLTYYPIPQHPERCWCWYRPVWRLFLLWFFPFGVFPCQLQERVFIIHELFTFPLNTDAQHRTDTPQVNMSQNYKPQLVI